MQVWAHRPRVSVALILSAALFLGLSMPSWANDHDVGMIKVTGDGVATSPPDMATINVSVLREAKTAKQALDANKDAMANVMNAMRAKGIADKDLQTSNFSINPRYVYRKGQDGSDLPEIVSYRVNNSLTIRILDITLLGDILDEAVTLGVNDGGQIMFGNQDTATLEMSARTDAVENAILKAQTIAQAANITLGDIVLISEIGNQARPMPIMQAEMAVVGMARDAAPVPIAAGETAYRVKVDVTFEIDQ